MNLLSIKLTNENIRLISLNYEPVNVLSVELLTELKTAFDEESESATIITSQIPVFSAGLNFKELLKPEKELKVYLSLFMGLMVKMLEYPKPLVFAINGHCAAGGTVLALTADYRIFSDGKYMMGLNELELGLPVPHSIYRLMQNVVGERVAYQSIMSARRYHPEDALSCGLVDEVSKDVLDAAMDETKILLALEQKAWQNTKLQLRSELINTIKTHLTKEVKSIVSYAAKEEFKSQLRTRLKA